MRALALILTSLMGGGVDLAWAACDPSLPCWPTEAEIAELERALDPSSDRSGLLRPNPAKPAEGGSPYPAGIPIYSPDDQALYGYDVTDLRPLYLNNETLSSVCFSSSFPPESRPICFASTRNNPMSGTPGFVAFPTDAAQVQAALNFAKDHDLCLSVLGTGHDFLDRHSSCEFGFLIRTSLLKGMALDASSKSVKLGAGLTFSEVQEYLAPDYYVASGWSVTVGILGWSIGGGHGPFGPSAGLGVDNVLSFDIVIADGSILTCDKDTNSDLFWAVRGGGGSTWGIITSLTLQVHSLPEGGATLLRFYNAGSFCGDGKATFEKSVEEYISILPDMDERWSGLTFIDPTASDDPSYCGLAFSVFAQYVFLGPESDAKEIVDKIAAVGLPMYESITINDWDKDYVKQADPEYLMPVPYMLASNSSVGGVPSVLVSRSKNAALSTGIKERFSNCAELGLTIDGLCSRVEIYHDITGNSKNEFSAEAVSVTRDMRTALYHVVGGGSHKTMDRWYELLGDHCYQNECAYEISEEAGGWKKRIFGEQYEPLMEIKEKYDPQGLFRCRHCIGDEEQ
mmetsp:Transcript_17322/g.34765  ORF Transcript_17322/g.34765 Transcript_17322/m.34765 type:complete len:569 (-) Transcript_17322:65-1771(-)